MVAKLPKRIEAENNLLHGIECKLNLNLEVLYQAYQSRSQLNYMSICVPHAKHSGGRDMAEIICKTFGMGIITVTKNGEVKTEVEPRLNMEILRPIILYEEQKYFAKAGSAGSGCWTPFKQTVKVLTEYVEKNPGQNLRAVVQIIDHHYSNWRSADNCLRKFIDSGIISTVTIKNGKLYPQENIK